MRVIGDAIGLAWLSIGKDVMCKYHVDTSHCACDAKIRAVGLGWAKRRHHGFASETSVIILEECELRRSIGRSFMLLP